MVLDYNQVFRSFHNKAEVAKACGYRVRLDGKLRRLDKRGELQPLVIVRPAPPPCPARDTCYDVEEEIQGGSPASPLSSVGAGEEEAMFFREVDEGRPRGVAMELAAEYLDISVVHRLQDRVEDAKLETGVRMAKRGVGGLFGRALQGQEAVRLQDRAGDAVQKTGVGRNGRGLGGGCMTGASRDRRVVDFTLGRWMLDWGQVSGGPGGAGVGCSGGACRDRRLTGCSAGRWMLGWSQVSGGPGGAWAGCMGGECRDGRLAVAVGALARHMVVRVMQRIMELGLGARMRR